jgi:formate hydrogenlyase subunit 6/NADH:ubiquinone oxidoreductase subunit I
MTSWMPMVPQAVRNLFSRPATLRYPAVPLEPVAGARGQVLLNLEACVYCGLCARKCPCVAISVSRDLKQLALEQLKCVSCGLCVDACPKRCLSMDGRPQPVVTPADRPATPPGQDTA